MRDAWIVSITVAASVVLPSVALALALGLSSPDAMATLAVFASLLVSTAVTAVPTGRALASSGLRRWAAIFVAPQLGGVGAIFAVLPWHTTYAWIGWAWSLGTVVASLVVIDRESLRALTGRVGASTRRAQAWFSVKASGALSLSSFAARIDVLMLGLLGTVADVGRYSVAVGTSQAVWLAGDAINTAIYGRLGASSRPVARSLAIRVAKLSALITAAQCVVLAVVAQPLVTAIFGREYADAGSALQILLVGSAAYSVVGPITTYFVNFRGRPEVALSFAAVNLSVCGLACLPLVPLLGTNGAAAASTLGYCAGALLAIVLFRRDRVTRGVRGSDAARVGEGN